MALSKKDQVRLAAESDLEVFIRLIHPMRLLGSVHRELIGWWNRQEAKSHQLVLLPRDHMKSSLIAYRVAWELTKNPALRILYISATSKLAIKQLKLIKDILTSSVYMFYWPDMVNPEETKRSKWTETEIEVDHPKRKLEVIRDPSVFTAGLVTTITGLHCDIAVLDDVVVDDNAYTHEGREKVSDQVSYLASVAGTDSRIWAVGTRYHPKDLYDELLNKEVKVYDAEGTVVTKYHLYEVYERAVESSGDGTGQFLWPRQQRSDGKWFGFNSQILAEKKAQYTNVTKFRAQYYNNPNDFSTATITPDMFQYYDKKNIRNDVGTWWLKNTKLNIVAGIDLAFTVNEAADFSCICVVGIDYENNYYVLDIDRFKTDKISEYFNRLLRMHNKWMFRKVRAETTLAQQTIIKDLRENYIKPYGLALVVEDFRPRGIKEDRIEAALQPRYANHQIWHYRGGNCELLEEELVLRNPSHDDIKDCLAFTVDFAVAPTRQSVSNPAGENDYYSFNKRFGGII